jgi:FimV-like protein
MLAKSMPVCSIALGLLIWSASACALDLGGLTVESTLGQPLSARIELNSATNEGLALLTARIADAAVYRQNNLEYPAVLARARLTIERLSDGNAILKITSPSPATEPYLDLLVDVSWASGRVLRKYTLLLDPPGMTSAQAVSSVYPPPGIPQTVSTPELPLAEHGHVVRRGDTLSKIAQQYKPPTVSLDQMLVAMFNANANAFDGNNMNRLRTGAIVSVPPAEQVGATPAPEATKVVRAQAADWHSYRDRVAASAPMGEGGEARQGASGRISTAVEDKAAPATAGRDQLRVSREAGVGKGGAAAAAEDTVARDKALRDAQTRIADLEKTLKDMQLALDLPNDTLTQAQRRAKAAKGIGAPTPPPVTVARAPETKAEPPALPPAAVPKAAPKAAPRAPEPSFLEDLTANTPGWAIAPELFGRLWEGVKSLRPWSAPSPTNAPESATTKGPLPSPSPPATPPIVYNADISPQLPRDKAAPKRPVLQAGQAATLRFDIGPEWKGSLLKDAPSAVVSPDILNSKENVPLTVILSCGFCEPHAESLKRMTYVPSQGRSNEVSFQFRPQRRPDGSAYTDKLQLGIINDKTGREHDRLVIDVAVSGAPTAPAVTVGNTAMVYGPSKGEARSDWSPDVLLYAMNEMGRKVSIEIEPVSDEMKRRLGSLALDAKGQRRTFRSGIDDARMVEAMTTSAYGVMSEVSMQGDFLKRLSARGIDAAVSEESRQSLHLLEAESKNVSQAIADIGQRLYRHLFANSPDVDLRKLITQLEIAAAEPRDRPLRLKILTNGISLPWQYLHPLGPEVDAQKFWGLRFSLSVLRNNTGTGVTGATPETQQARKVVFARYGSSKDPTVPLAEEQEQQLRRLPVADTDLIEVDNGTDLLANLERRRKDISAIVTFLHAKFTTLDSEPHLLFNDGDIVTSDRLEQLLNKVPMEEQQTRYLTGAPLVILNACETGPSVNLPHVSLENAMFQLGAQGVVVTEVSVWIPLGHDVATKLISRLGKGEAIGDALTATRRDLYEQKKNPLGLLYVYYGDPAATLRH